MIYSIGDCTIPALHRHHPRRNKYQIDFLLPGLNLPTHLIDILEKTQIFLDEVGFAIGLQSPQL